MACAALAAPEPVPLRAPDPPEFLPYEGPFEEDRLEAQRIYEVVLAHFADSLVARFEARDKPKRPTRYRLDLRIGRFSPYTHRVLSDSQHNSAWLASLAGRFRVLGACKSRGSGGFCSGVIVLLADVRRPDQASAEVELLNYANGPRGIVFAARRYSLLKEGAAWRVVRTRTVFVT